MAGDYPLPQDKQFGEWMRRIEADIRELKGTRDAGFTTLAQGEYRITDASGNVVAILDGNGIQTLDDSGVVRARFGLLSNGDYGMEVLDASGVPIDVGGSLFGVRAARGSDVGVTPANSNPGTSLTGAAVSVTVGQTGRLLLITGAFINTDHGSGTATTIEVRAYVDGDTTTNVLTGNGAGGTLGASNEPVNFTLSGSPSTSHIITLAPGLHTIQLYARRFNAGENSHISGAFIVAFPL